MVIAWTLDVVAKLTVWAGAAVTRGVTVLLWLMASLPAALAAERPPFPRLKFQKLRVFLLLLEIVFMAPKLSLDNSRRESEISDDCY